MRCFLFLFILLLLGSSVASQTIDSLRLTDNSTPPSFYIEGTFPHTGFELVRIDYAVASDTAVVFLYFKECGGFLTLTQFDSVITLDQSFPVVSNIYVKALRDSNTDDSLCLQRAAPVLTDSMFISKSSQIGIEGIHLKNQALKIYPNPASKQIVVEIEEARRSQLLIEIKDLSGKVVLSPEWDASTNERINSVDVEQLPAGVYFLSIADEQGFYEAATFRKK